LTVALHDAAKEVARLKQGSGSDLLTQGSSVLIQALLAADLIDEISLITFPVVLGKGKRFFGEGAKPGALKLTDAKLSAAGVTVSKYATRARSRPARSSFLSLRRKKRRVARASSAGIDEPILWTFTFGYDAILACCSVDLV
jgi:hypothetical protein